MKSLFAWCVKRKAGLALEYPLDMVMAGLSLDAQLMIRWLEFDFDADSGVIDDDGEFGGFGIKIALGVQYRF